MSNPVNLEKYAEYIGPIVEKEWHRKNFEDFDYLTIELNDGRYWAIIILLLVFNIVMSSWIVTNNYKTICSVSTTHRLKTCGLEKAQVD